ncbi:MAG: cupin domain-containing protein [Salinibacterium sp.]|nr:cupin domain-containing protein [Salinibacterium sp.]
MLQATTIILEHTSIPPEQVVEGSPTTGLAVLVEGTPEIGVWEHTPGVSTDIEVDELHVVLAGDATLEIEGHETLYLVPGAIVRLTTGMRTTWTVRETLRKLYVA